MRKIILIILMVLIPSAYALQGGSSNSYSTDATRYIFYHNFNFTGQTSVIPNEELGSLITEVNEGGQVSPVYNWSIQSNRLTASMPSIDGDSTKLSTRLNVDRNNFSFELAWNVSGSMDNQLQLFADNTTSTVAGGAEIEAFLLQMIGTTTGSIKLRDAVFTTPTAWDKPTSYALGDNMSLIGVVMFKNATSCSFNLTAYRLINKTGILTYVENGSQGEHTCGNGAIGIRNLFLRMSGDSLGGDISIGVDEFVVWDGIEARPTISTNTTPTITLNKPINNNATHNNTMFFNFTITDAENDFLNFSLYADENATPTTLINRTGNVTDSEWIIIYTFNKQINESINGTYYWKVNGTDNSTNGFSSAVRSFNITNNINLYNVTNTSLTNLPLEAGKSVRIHYNLTNKAGQKDNITSFDIRWYINNTLYVPANNQTTLNGTNSTNNTNIIVEVRINTYLGETGWTEYVNSSQATVGDTTTPTISGQVINGNSFTTTQRINVTVNCTDNAAVSYARVEWNRTGVFANDTMSLLNANQYSYDNLFIVGNYNATNFHCADGSSNIAQDMSNFTFTVTTAPSGDSGSSGGGGGGGGGLPSIPQCKDNELLVSSKCVNASLFNVTFKIIGLKNIQPIVFYRTCGGFQEWRQMIRTNKVLKNAEFDKPQANTNITIIGSDVLVVKKLRTSKIAERVDMGYLKMTDTTNLVTRVSFVLRIVNICNPLTYLFVVIPIIIIIFRKKLMRLFKKGKNK